MSHRERRAISIWEPARVEGEEVWLRPKPGPLGDHYCDRRVLRPRGRRQRICFLGESTAAGYLLAPHLTPARALAHRLGDDWEVVDLARTNERLASLVATAEAALQLAPDRLVVFTGNNWNLLETPDWSPYAPSEAARRHYAAELERGGLPGPARAAAGELRGKVERAFARLAELGVAVTVVVPEVNLADWESPQPVGWLPADGVARWYRLLETARSHLAAGEARRARVQAAELLALDGGGVSTSLRLLARCWRLEGDLESARTAARAEIEAVRYAAMAVLPAPQATATVQELLRAAARRLRFEVVDLPDLFGREDRLPGRRLFYDYCHLTPEGIDLAMSAVASSIAGSIRTAKLPLGARARAIAELGAAVHGVHRGLAGEPVTHWLRRAIASDAGSTEVLLDLIAARAAPVPAVLAARREPDLWLGHQHGWRRPDLDAEVIVAAEGLVDRRELAARLGKPRVEPWTPLDRFYPEAMDHEDSPPSLYSRSPWPRSCFAVVAPDPVEIELVARLPAAAYPRGGSLEVRFGTHRVERLALGPRWTRHRIRLPPAPAPGLARLTLDWPLPETPGEEMRRRAIDRLEAGRPADVHPVFGEVLDLRLARRG